METFNHVLGVIEPVTFKHIFKYLSDMNIMSLKSDTNEISLSTKK